MDQKNELSFASRITSAFTNKPIKKIYRIIVFGLIVYLCSNSSSNNSIINDVMLNYAKKQICHGIDNTTIIGTT